MPDDGLISLRSAHSGQETIARVEAELAAKGVTVFAKIDHVAGASAAGMTLRLTTLIISATHAQARRGQRAGIDLPLKALVWEDGDGTVWLSYNDPAWIARRHSLGPQIEPAVHAMSAMLAAIALKGTGADPA